MGKATDFKFDRYIYRVHTNKEKMSPNALKEFPNYSSHGRQIRQIHLQGPSEQKPVKIFREKGTWAYPGTPQFWGVPPIISGTGKATDVKFGRYIYRVHPSKSPLKISEKKDRGRIQGLPNFLGYPLLSQKRVKPRTSNSADTFTGSIRAKAR